MKLSTRLAFTVISTKTFFTWFMTKLIANRVINICCIGPESFWTFVYTSWILQEIASFASLTFRTRTRCTCCTSYVAFITWASRKPISFSATRTLFRCSTSTQTTCIITLCTCLCSFLVITWQAVLRTSWVLKIITCCTKSALKIWSSKASHTTRITNKACWCRNIKSRNTIRASSIQLVLHVVDHP